MQSDSELSQDATVKAMAEQSGVEIPPAGLPSGAAAPAPGPGSLSSANGASPAGPRTIDTMLQELHLQRRSIAIPELGGLVFYFRSNTLGDQDTLRNLPQETTPWHVRAVALLIAKAEKEDGSPHFLSGDSDALIRRVDSKVILRLINFMYDQPTPTKEGAAAAVASDPT